MQTTVTLTLQEFDEMREQIKEQEKRLTALDEALDLIFKTSQQDLLAQVRKLEEQDAIDRIRHRLGMGP